MKELSMKRTAPLLTLLAGLGVGTVLLIANNAVSSPDPAPDTAPAALADVAPSPQSPVGAAVADAVEPSTGLSGAPVAKVANKVTATWAGDVDGGKATIAISAKDGVAIAYVCDGDRVEAWLQGTAVDGKLDLTGKKAKLTGTFANGRATGTVNVSRWTYTFDVAAVKKPSGLYRATANVRNAEVVSGWIVVGKEVTGSVSVAGESRRAPELDLATGTAILDGVTLNAVAVS
jgi:hypothetical protein